MIERRWNVNGEPVEVAFADDRRLLDVLRDELGLIGSKEGCGEGECGACSVVLDGRLVLGCLTLAAAVADDAEIVTVEGLEQSALGRAVRAAFLDVGAVQCGYCASGMLVAAYSVLLRDPNPTADRVKVALSGNLCRCTGYGMIVDAVRAASDVVRSGGEGTS